MDPSKRESVLSCHSETKVASKQSWAEELMWLGRSWPRHLPDPLCKQTQLVAVFGVQKGIRRSLEACAGRWLSTYPFKSLSCRPCALMQTVGGVGLRKARSQSETGWASVLITNAALSTRSHFLATGGTKIRLCVRNYLSPVQRSEGRAVSPNPARQEPLGYIVQ